MNSSAPVFSLADPLRRPWNWQATQAVLQALFVVGCQYRARGFEQIPPTGGLLLMNHQSFLDPILAAMPLQRPIVFLARDTLFKVPGLGRIMKGWSMISIKRGSAGTASLREAVRRMEEGYLVAIFPEGTRTADGSVSELKTGFLAMIKRSTVPVIPVGIAGAFQSFPRDAWIPRPARIRVVFGDPLDPLAIQAYRANRPGPDVLALAQAAVHLCFDSATSWLGEG